MKISWFRYIALIIIERVFIYFAPGLPEVVLLIWGPLFILAVVVVIGLDVRRWIKTKREHNAKS